MREVRNEIREGAKTCPIVFFRDHKSCGFFRKQNEQKCKPDSGEWCTLLYEDEEMPVTFFFFFDRTWREQENRKAN